MPANLDPVDRGRQRRRRARAAASSTRSRPRRCATGLLWCGTDDGLVWRDARRRAALAERHAAASSTPWSKVGIIEASHFDADTAYAAVDRHRLDDFDPVRLPHARRRQDLARRSRAGIPAGSFVNVVREDPERRGLLYAGHRDRRLRLVRRRRRLAAAPDEPAQLLGARHLACGAATSSSHARPRRSGCSTTSSPLRQLDANDGGGGRVALRAARSGAPESGGVPGDARAEGRALGRESAAGRDPRLSC